MFKHNDWYIEPQRYPVYFLTVAIISIFITEFMVTVLQQFIVLSPNTWIFFDAALVTALLIPMLYVFLYRPMISTTMELLKAEKTLEQTEHLFSKLMENSSDVVAILDSRGAIKFITTPVQRILGYKQYDLLHKEIFDYVHPKDISSLLSEFNTMAETPGAIATIECRFRNKDGSWLYVDIVYNNLTHNPDVMGIVVSVRDISERKQREKERWESEQRYTNFFLNNHAPILLIDRVTGNIVDANPAAAAFYGYSRDELKAKNIGEINNLPPEQIQQKMKISFSEQQRHFYFKHCLASGELRDVEVYSGKISAHGKELLYSMVHDVTEQKLAVDQLRKLSSAVEQSPSVVVITDSEGKIEYVNPKFSELTGYAPEEVIGQNPWVLKSGDKSSDDCINFWRTIKSGQKWAGEFHNKKKNGQLYWEFASISPVLDERGVITNFVVVKEDITDRKEAEDKIKYYAFHDALTGLANRVMFESQLSTALIKAEQSKEIIAVVFLDLDGFKSVNDTYGHAMGDRLLSVVAERLKSCVRERDTVARLGGDEFTLLFTRIKRTEDIDRIAQKVLAVFQRPFRLGDFSIHISTSIGISVYPVDGKNAKTLLINADSTMYRAKQSGKNRYILCGS